MFPSNTRTPGKRYRLTCVAASSAHRLFQFHFTSVKRSLESEVWSQKKSGFRLQTPDSRLFFIAKEQLTEYGKRSRGFTLQQRSRMDQSRRRDGDHRDYRPCAEFSGRRGLCRIAQTRRYLFDERSVRLGRIGQGRLGDFHARL